MKKKGFLLAIVLLLALALVMTGCAKKEEPKVEQPKEEPKQEVKQEGDGSWERVTKAGKIVAGLDDNYPPMGFRDEKGQLTGFDIDMAKEMSKRLGIEIEWQPTAWDGVVASLKAKKFDVIISGMTVTEERLKEVNFAGPYIFAAQAVCVQDKNDTIKTNADLKGKVVGTQNGSTGYKVAEELLNKGELKEIKGYSDYALAFQDLKIGRVDAVISDNYVIAGYIKNMPGEFKMTGELFAEETNGIAVRKEDKELYDKLNQVIKDMIQDGTLAKISEEWLGGDATAK
ncbi:MAG: hypothetical protein JM58_02795 [Peptococcaceae bacterium BICA1-8]|nr:MAG: hypothetical protein JM58_02795 [Peptococcaceae bacterium BICA1-8]